MEKANSKTNYEVIACIKNNINNNRKTFDWSHLSYS